jgi:hypothetical protein
MLTTFTVNVDYDVVSWSAIDSEVSLREAVERTEVNPNQDTIDFNSSLSGATITLGKDVNGNSIATGELSITESVTIDGTIDGAGPSNVSLNITIDASGNDPTPNSTPLDSNTSDDGDGIRIFNITDPADTAPLVTMIGLKLTGGDVDGNGGAIQSTTGLKLENCVIEGNSATSQGGGLYMDVFGSARFLELKHTQVRGNIAFEGGGVFVNTSEAGISIVESSSITGNTATSSVGNIGRGGGLFVEGIAQINISDALISENHSSLDSGGMRMDKGVRTIYLIVLTPLFFR